MKITKSKLQQIVLEELASIVNENEYAICTSSIGKTAKAGTKRSEWTEAEEERYERCKKKVKKKEG